MYISRTVIARAAIWRSVFAETNPKILWRFVDVSGCAIGTFLAIRILWNHVIAEKVLASFEKLVFDLNEKVSAFVSKPGETVGENYNLRIVKLKLVSFWKSFETGFADCKAGTGNVRAIANLASATGVSF